MRSVPCYSEKYYTYYRFAHALLFLQRGTQAYYHHALNFNQLLNSYSTKQAKWLEIVLPCVQRHRTTKTKIRRLFFSLMFINVLRLHLTDFAARLKENGGDSCENKTWHWLKTFKLWTVPLNFFKIYLTGLGFIYHLQLYVIIMNFEWNFNNMAAILGKENETLLAIQYGRHCNCQYWNKFSNDSSPSVKINII